MRRMSLTRSVGSVAISPDGALLAYTLRGREGTTLHVVPMPKGDAAIEQSKDKLVTASDATNCSNNAPVWSPDATTLAFTSTCTSKEEKPGQEQIFLYSVGDGKTRELTHLTGNISQAAWSPGGKMIAFLFVENATRSAGALDAMKPLVGVIGEDTFEVQGVYGAEVATGKSAWLVPATKTMYSYEFAWSPDSREIAHISADAPGENNWWVAKLYVSPAVFCPATCEEAGRREVILDPQKVAGALHGLQIAVPRWSPDGKKIALIGGLMSDQGSTGGDVWVIDAKPGAAPVDVTPGIDGTPTFEAWVNDHEVGFVEDRRGHILLPDYDIHTKALVPGSATELGEVSVGGGAIKNAISFDKNDEFAFVESSFTQAPEIWGGPGDHLHPLTHFNEGLPAPTSKVESVEWENEGFHVQGWLAYPKDYDAGKHYPIIVTVHGGPSASAGPRYGGSMWSGLGYFEFMPNPRGSFGQGEAFTQANRKDFGYGDLRDIEKGLDTIEARLPVDKSREGITGWSYGGFMTMFAVTQTHRFRAAVAGAGLSDWLSYYGENSIDQWMIPFFGASVYDDPAVYAKSSAMTFIKQVTTPTLVIVGDRDGECPAPQSFEFWHALRDLGVKTQLVVYPDEGHGFRNPEHLRDRTEREVRWFAENMAAK
jgi:dipeptidyl aminopeptidase/acylaminoacyl peptidase